MLRGHPLPELAFLQEPPPLLRVRPLQDDARSQLVLARESVRCPYLAVAAVGVQVIRSTGMPPS